MVNFKNNHKLMSEKFGPCLDKKCSWCCDPVKVPKSFPDERIPVNGDGEKIWIA